MESLLLFLASWVLPAAGLAAWAAHRRFARGPRQRAAPAPALGPSPLDQFGLRVLDGRVEARLASSPADVEAFVAEILTKRPNSMVFREQDSIAYPCLLAAIPEAGFSFELRALDIGPFAIGMATERLILELSARHMGSKPAKRPPASRVETRHIATPNEMDDFASALMRRHPGAMVMRVAEAAPFPCAVAAIPDLGLSFHLLPVRYATPPHAQLAVLEARILSSACSPSGPSSPTPARAPSRRL